MWGRTVTSRSLPPTDMKLSIKPRRKGNKSAEMEVHKPPLGCLKTRIKHACPQGSTWGGLERVATQWEGHCRMGRAGQRDIKGV
jgi:hypothetical protein